MDKKKSTNMYELLSVNNNKSKQDPLSNLPPSSSGEEKLNTISGFINSPMSLTNDNTPKIKEIFENIKQEINKNEINIGYIKEEKGIGKAVEEFYSVADNKAFALHLNC